MKLELRSALSTIVLAVLSIVLLGPVAQVRGERLLPGPEVNTNPPNGLGVKKIAVILFNFADDPRTSPSAADVRRELFYDADSTNAFYREVSFGQMWIAGQFRSDGDVFGYYTLPAGTTRDARVLEGQLDLLASANGFNVANYDAVLYTQPPIAGGRANAFEGQSGKAISMNGGFDSYTASHEIFHILGLDHANGIRFRSGGYDIADYGDVFDVQGDFGFDHPSTIFKARMGWYQTHNFLTIPRGRSGSYTYRLQPIERPSAGLLAVRIPIPSDRLQLTYGWTTDPSTVDLYYYLEFRQPAPFEQFQSHWDVANGVSIRIGTDIDTNHFTMLVDTTPDTNNYWDAPLTVGRSYVDGKSGVILETLSVSSTEVVVRIVIEEPARAGDKRLADVDGDGRDDVVVFGGAGVSVARSTGSTFGPPELWVASYGLDAGGWTSDYPRLVADVDGDRRADVVGFGHAGVYVSLSTGSSFASPQLVIRNFGYAGEAGGWRVASHPRLAADVNGDGKADIVGFGWDGVYVSLSQSAGATPSFGAVRLAYAGGFDYVTNGWRVERHPRLLADVSGDGKADVVGFGETGVWVAVSTSTATTPSFAGARLASTSFGAGAGAGGWRIEYHPRALADVDGDGKADVVGFGWGGAYVARSTTSGTTASFASPVLGVASYGYSAGGWRVDQHPRLLADVDGDRRADIIGFGSAGTYVSRSIGSTASPAFASPFLAIENFGHNQGWRVGVHPRVTGDVDGDGAADIAGFGSAGVWVAGALPGYARLYTLAFLELEFFGTGR